MTDALLCVHSTGTGPSLWSGAAAAAARLARSVSLGELTPPLLGYPPNPPVVRGRRVDARDDARELLRAAAAATDEGTRLHLVAHSYGGLVALLAAPELGPRLASMFLVEPVVFGALAEDAESDADAVAQARAFGEHPWFLTDEAQGGSEAWLEMFVDYWNRPGSWARMPEPLRAHSRALGWKMFQEVRSCFLERTPFADFRIEVPCTVVIGGRSPVASRAMGRALARGRAGVVLEEVPEIGHMAPLTAPAPIHAALARHLARVRPEASDGAPVAAGTR